MKGSTEGEVWRGMRMKGSIEGVWKGARVEGVWRGGRVKELIEGVWRGARVKELIEGEVQREKICGGGRWRKGW